MPDPQLQSIVEKMVAAGEPEDSIALVIQHYKPQAASDAAPAPAAPQGDLGRFAGVKMLGDAVIGAGKAALNHPVQSLAVLGGLAAAPLTGGASIPASIAAAGLGAAGGAGIGSIVNAARGGDDGPSTAAGVGKTMATEGALGALGEGVGKGASKLLSIGGKTLYKSILRPSIPLQREFGDVAEVGLREGARVSDAGAAKVSGRLKSNSAKIQQLIADAEASGASPIAPKEVAGEFGDVMRQGARQAQLGRPDPRPDVVSRIKSFSGKNANGIPLGRAQELKSEAQDLASRAYRAADRGGPMTDLSAEADKAMARGLRGGIEKRVPAVKDVNADSQQLIGLSRALEDASFRNVPGVGFIRTLLGNFAPGTTSGMAIGAHRAGGLPFNDAMKTALIAALGGQQE
jgi:hypothetical protein